MQKILGETLMPRRKPVFRLPKQISILGRVYIVKRVRMHDYGCCDPTTAEIHVRRGLKGDDLSSTFLHECIHAILYESGVEHRWDDANFTESVVRALDNGLSRAFDTNSLLVRK